MDSDNFVTVTGRIATEPELKFLPSGAALANFRLAHPTRRKEGDKWVDGDSHFFTVQSWRVQAEKLAHLPKGTPVRVTGKLVTDTWKTKDGENRAQTVINATGVDVMTIMLQDIESTKVSTNLRWGGFKDNRVNTEVTSLVYDEAPF